MQDARDEHFVVGYHKVDHVSPDRACAQPLTQFSSRPIRERELGDLLALTAQTADEFQCSHRRISGDLISDGIEVRLCQCRHP